MLNNFDSTDPKIWTSKLRNRDAIFFYEIVTLYNQNRDQIRDQNVIKAPLKTQSINLIKIRTILGLVLKNDEPVDSKS